MKNKKNLLGRVTVDFPAELVPDNVLPYMGHLVNELNKWFVAFLRFYANDHPNEIPFEFDFDGNKLVTFKYRFSDDSDTEVSSILSRFFSFMFQSCIQDEYDSNDPCSGCLKESCYGCDIADPLGCMERMSQDEWYDGYK